MMKSTHRQWLGVLSLTTMLVAPQLTAAQQPVNGSGDWYYQMGGAAPISPAPNVNAQVVELLGSVGLQVPRACGSLDPTTAISNALGNVADGLDNLDNLLVAAATNVAAALPAIILQRANPGLYDHFQNATSAAKETYELSIKSCQQIVEDDAAGKNPFSGWIRTSQRDSWLAQLNDPDADSIEAETEIEADAGNDGVLWLAGERKGGLDQPELPVIQDTIGAGYNLILGRDVNATGAPAGVEARLVELFATPDEARIFARDVLGDLIIQTCQGCTPGSVAATGALLKSLDDEKLEIREQLGELVAGNGSPSEADLAAISSSTVLITAKLVEDLRVIEEEQDRALFIGRVSAEMALQNTTEKGFALRRMLLAGRHVPEIANSEQATRLINEKLAELESLIASLSFEQEMQDRLTARTALVVTQIAEETRKASLNDPDVNERDPQDLILQGRVRPE